MTSPVPAAVLSFVTTLHVAAVLLLAHRAARPGRRVLLLPALAFGVLVWLLPSHSWLLAGLAAQTAWVVACERLIPGPVSAVAPMGPAPAPSEPAGSGAGTPAKGPVGFVATRVLAVVDETPEIRTFRLERPRGFTFRPGQFLMVRVSIGSREAVRCYSISSSPEAAGYLEISVRRQGQASGAIHDGVRAGGVLPIRGPGGSFVYPEGADTPIVLHAGGVGITPMISMLRHAVLADPGRPVTLLYTVRTEADVAFRDVLAVLARRAPAVRVCVALSRGGPAPGFVSGRIDGQRIARYVPEPAKAIHLICGPGPMIASLRETLAGLGVPPDRIRFEAFEAAVAEAAGTGSETAPRSLRLARSGATTKVSAGTSLLDAAEAAGGSIDSMCRAGSCGTCRTRLLSGRVDDAGTALGAAERAEGWVLPCVAKPLEDCVLDA